MDWSPDKVSHELSVRGREWADKDAAYFALDETKKDVLSQCMALVNNQDLSQAALEQQARLLPEWKQNQQALIAARKAKNIASINLKVWETYIELIRTKEATNRAEMKL